MMKRIILLILILGAIGGAIGFYLYNKPVESVAKKESDHQVSASTLLSAFQSDEAAANEKYLGKVVLVEGTIGSIETGANPQVILDAGDMMSRVSCVLEESAEAFAKRGKRKGDQIRLKGFCTGSALGEVVVDRCVVVE